MAKTATQITWRCPCCNTGYYDLYEPNVSLAHAEHYCSKCRKYCHPADITHGVIVADDGVLLPEPSGGIKMSTKIEWLCPKCGAKGETISEGDISEPISCTRCGNAVDITERKTGDFNKFASEFRVLPSSDCAKVPVKCPQCGERCAPYRMDLLSGALHCVCGHVLGPLDFDPEAEESRPNADSEVSKSTGLELYCSRCESYFEVSKDYIGETDSSCPECGRPYCVVHSVEKSRAEASKPDAASKPSADSIFAEAEQTINGPRAKDYGDASESFDRIAALWSAYLNTPVSSADVAMVMSLLKMVRLKHSGFAHHDSFVDLLGYVGLAHKVSGKK